MRRARLRIRASFGGAATAAVFAWAALTFAAIAALAAVHLDDRFDVGAASGVWMGLAAAARAGVWYPAVYAHGFFGGTRYMPAPILLELVGRAVSGEYLVSAKSLVYAVNVVLYVLVYRATRRQGAPAHVGLAIVATVLASSAATTTSLGLRWDSLAVALQLGGLALVADRRTTPRVGGAGILFGLALATKVTSLWAIAALAIMLARRPRQLTMLVAAAAATLVIVTGTIDALSDGRMLRQLRDFTFAGSGSSSLSEGLHRYYQLGIRNERSLPLLLFLAIVALALAVARRRAGLYELGLVLALPIVIVVLRDFGAYENHLLDLEVLCGITVAGLWGDGARAARSIRQWGYVAVLFVAFVAAARYTLVPDIRAAASHELRGRLNPVYSLHPAPAITAQGTCALFEDATLPILSGEQPLVLDAFITHRLQTRDPRALEHLLTRIRERTLSTIALSFPLTNRGWFQTLDFGTAFADAVGANYRLTAARPAVALYVYTPRRPPTARPRCRLVPLGRWHG